MLTIIPLPEDFVSTIMSNMGDLFVDLAPYIALVLSLILGMLAIRILINALHK